MEEEIKALKEKIAELEAKIGNSDNSEEFPKDGDKYWYIGDGSSVLDSKWTNKLCFSSIANGRKEIGNCFKTEEEAYQAVEKLKAWKRLKDAGFEFQDFEYHYNSNIHIEGDINIHIEGDIYYAAKTSSFDDICKDLNLLFGGDDE